MERINLISKQAPMINIGKLGFGHYLGQLEIRAIRNLC